MAEYRNTDQRRFIKLQGYKNEPIRLISCGTGAKTDGIAKDLANRLGVKVTAPSNTIWLWPNGSLTIGPDADTFSGVWRDFLPGINP